MRNRKTQGFTLIELLIVIAIIGILAAVLIPNLLQARQRAFDTAAQTCLKEIATNEEMEASTDPWEYTDGTVYAGAAATPHSNGISSCANVLVTSTGPGDGSTYAYTGEHANGANEYQISMGSGVTVVPVVP